VIALIALVVCVVVQTDDDDFLTALGSRIFVVWVQRILITFIKTSNCFYSVISCWARF
jgi:hypothetical protein